MGPFMFSEKSTLHNDLALMSPFLLKVRSPRRRRRFINCLSSEREIVLGCLLNSGL